MSDIDTSTELEHVGATDNGSTDAVEASSAPATEAAVVEAPKAPSLDEALAKAFEKHTPSDDKGKPATAAAPATNGKTIDPISGRTIEPMNAPAGWTPLLRAKWGAIDPEVQQFIHDREKNMAQTISRTEDHRKLATDFKSALSPYDGTFRQMNVPALDVVKNVMGQWHQMQTGTPQQKAQMIDGLIRTFQPDIPTLVALANGQAPRQQVTAPAPQPNIDQLVEQRLAAREEQQLSTQAESAITTFSQDPKNEFYSDVSVTMGKIIEAGLVTGNTLPEMMSNAYKLACQQHPEVAQIMASRSNAAPTVRPVGSVKPGLNGGQRSKPAATRYKTMDDAVNAAWKMHSA